MTLQPAGSNASLRCMRYEPQAGHTAHLHVPRQM